MTERCPDCGGPVVVRCTGEPGTDDEEVEYRALPDSLEDVEGEAAKAAAEDDAEWKCGNCFKNEVTPLRAAVERLFNGCKTCGRKAIPSRTWWDAEFAQKKVSDAYALGQRRALQEVVVALGEHCLIEDNACMCTAYVGGEHWDGETWIPMTFMTHLATVCRKLGEAA